LRKPICSIMFALLAMPAMADGHASNQGDVAAGEAQFKRQCVACHLVADEDGNVLAGRTAKVGPNLYGLAGRTIGSVDGFRYADSILEVQATGTTWDEEKFVAFVQNPSNWLRETLDDRRARSKMAYQVRQEAQAYDIYAYLASLAE